MSWMLCIIFKKKKYCFPIPMLIPLKRFGPPPPPEQWISKSAIDPRVAGDLQLLSSINEYASGLSASSKAIVIAAVQQAGKQIAEKLPEEAQLNFG